MYERADEQKLLAQGVLLLELLGLQPVLKPYAKVQLLSQKIEDNRLQIVQTIVFFYAIYLTFLHLLFKKYSYFCRRNLIIQT